MFEEKEKRISELAAALGIAIGYLERMSQAKLKDPESHKRVLDKLTAALEGVPQISFATAVIEVADHVCERATAMIKAKGDLVTEEEKKKDYLALAAQIRAIVKGKEA